MATEWQCSRRIGVRMGEHLGYFPTLDAAKDCVDSDMREQKMEPRGDWQSDEDRHRRVALWRVGGTSSFEEVTYDVRPRRQ